MNIVVDVDRTITELEELAKFSDAEPPGVTRIVFTPADVRARQWLKEKFSEAELSVREDAVGNTFARWEGTEPDLPAIGTGSHIDAIPNSGRYDGTVGVLGGLEAIRALQKAGYRPRKSIELLLFTSEEPTRFGLGCLGSRLLSGVLSPEDAADLRDSGGSTLESVRSAAGFEGALNTVQFPQAYYDGFIELHIEQGPALEREGIALGVVTEIAAPASLRIVVEGEGGHAGAVLMPQRRDALTAAAELILSVESAALSTGVMDTVATTGICDVFPGAVNSVPSRVKLEIDVRDVEQERRNVVLSLIEQASQTVANKRGVSVRSELLNADAPAACARFIIESLMQTCAAQGFTHKPMISRAYHDSLFMARIAPVGMLFIPCREGVSHRPDEYASPESIASGVRVLAHALARLAA
ncbi:MAG: M20 family metallo-hydrolase [Bryobacteraceae bacterium]